ncbi:hypothetical protein FNL56_01500 [Tardiphaga sp. vice304]|uniref:PGN_0703 family putative restriction endonuclease n=1 Tax=Tardiphaga sp. vice304 TaxID=2592817 RepID=UPI0011642307|nr:hypothetical protein [Tardiphaga sp. vice304]QDM24969.1 hypothetical protein FNL56_01500 [Tardiphaga sp. vice304]
MSLYSAPPLPRIPLIPQSILKDHNVACIIDTRFRSAARLLQHLWLRDSAIVTGVHVRKSDDGDIVMDLGSMLEADAARSGRNFLTPEIHAFVRHATIMREEGAAIDEHRLFYNALSSTPMSFNVFAPLALDLQLATAVFRSLLPAFVASVENIRFETSPGRREARFLDDGTAFDLAIEVLTPDGESATVFIETKYSESMEGPAARLRDRYDEAARQVRLYSEPDAVILRSLALEQLWREHMLAQLAVDQGVTDRAMFVVIGPRLNRRVQTACRVYKNELIPDDDLDADRVQFQSITLEKVIDTINEAGATDLARALWARYCDFERVFHLAMTEYTLPASSSPTTTAAAEKEAAQVNKPRRQRKAGSISAVGVASSTTRLRRAVTYGQ